MADSSRARAALGTLFLLSAVLAAGCAGPTDNGSEPAGDGAKASRDALNATYYLKGGHRLDAAPPASATPVREPAAPTANAFANEAVELFSGLILTGSTVTAARLAIHYAVDAPTPNAFRDASLPPRTTHFVFWLGSNGTYPLLATLVGDAVLLPDYTYHAEVEFSLPRGGWTIPAGERIELLVAPLATNADASTLHYLVDAPTTPSRVELVATATPIAEPAAPTRTVQAYTLAGDSALGRLPPGPANQVRHPISVAPGTTFLKLEVLWQSTAAGKSDLDFTLETQAGSVAAASTTPFQNETIRLFQPQLAGLESASLVAVVDAYSGALTTFDLAVSTATGPAP